MRTAFALIVIGGLAFVALSRDLIAEVTGRPFLGINPVQASSLQLDADFSVPNLDGITALETNIFNGRIRVTSGTQPRLSITKRGRVEVKTERRANTFVITGRTLVQNCWSCKIDVEMTVPENLELKLETSNGAIEVNGAARSLKATTSNGAIAARDTGAASAYLETSNGGIDVRGARGAVEAITSNGRIRLEHTQGSLKAETSNSSIVLDRVVLPAKSSSLATTSNGSIEIIGLSGPDGVRVEGSTSNGGLSLQMPGFNVQQDRTEFTATRDGSASASLMLETSNGGITVRP
jgi:DUF4097 and DUF4098 domain-containing protein YvlB